MASEPMTDDRRLYFLHCVADRVKSCACDSCRGLVEAVREIDRLRAEAAELREALKTVRKCWTFNSYQQHTHTWHDWADCIKQIDDALKEVSP